MIDQAIIMAGGSSTRLRPNQGNKHLLPIYDKPMIYYPLSTLMLTGIRKFYVVVDPVSQLEMHRQLSHLTHCGIEIRFFVQDKPRGIAEGLLICREAIGNKAFALILGDNVFHGHRLPDQILEAGASIGQPHWPTQAYGAVFAKQVADPERYGVVYFDQNWRPAKIIEKPRNPSSNWAVAGLYLYTPQVMALVEKLEPSARGELEITALNSQLLAQRFLDVHMLGRGTAWLDTGTPAAMLQASEYVAAIQERQGEIIACPEEIAMQQGWLSRKDFWKLDIDKYYPTGSVYGRYVRDIANGGVTRGD